MNRSMFHKRVIANIRDVAIAGFLFLLPVYIIFIIITKAWTSLSSLGTNIAAMFGMKSIFGVKGSSVVSGLLLIALWILCGLLVRVSFVAAFQKRVEGLLAKYIPGYDSYKAIAEEKLHKTVKTIPYSSVLLRQDECWRPAYLIEQDHNGNCVVFVPDTPNTNAGQVVLTRREQVTIVPSLTANQLEVLLKRSGKGLLGDLDGAGDALTKPHLLRN